MDTDPVAEQMLWPDRQTGPLQVRLWFAPVRGKPAIVGVEVWGVQPVTEPWRVGEFRPAGEPGAASYEVRAWDRLESGLPDARVGSRELRQLKLGDLLDRWVACNLAVQLAGERLGDGELFEPLHWMADQSSPRRPGRKPIDADQLATVAALYLQAERNGDRAPAKAVERGLRKLGTDLKQPTVRSWILAARKRGFLPPVGGTANG